MNKKIISLIFKCSASRELYWGHIHHLEWYNNCRYILRPTVGSVVLWM